MSNPSSQQDRRVGQGLDVFACPLEGVSLIEASAGTGKTWNICGLYLRLLIECELKVSQILVVTFTNAATAELRERIRQRLVQMAAHLRSQAVGQTDPFVLGLSDALSRDAARAGSPEQQLAKIDAALASFDEASIFTIHGFCQRALAETAFAARGALQNELLIDDSLLRSQVVHDFWRRHIASDQLPAFLAAYLLACKDSPEGFGRLLARRLARPMAAQRWPERIDEPFELDTRGFETLFNQIAGQWQLRGDELTVKLKQALGDLKGNIYSSTRIDHAAQACAQYFQTGRVQNLLGADPRLLQLFSSEKLSKSSKKGKSPPADPFFDGIQSLLDRKSAIEADLGIARLRLIRGMLDECALALDQEKRARHQIAYDDMLQRLHRALTDSDSQWLADELGKRFPAALIDEFQDTDPIQFGIFERIYRNRSAPVFLVGDPKQSIYAFRSADLHTYLDARAHAKRLFTLDRNQRSSAQLVQALNALFACNPKLFMLEGLEYQEVAAGERQRDPLHGAAVQGAALQVWALPGMLDQAATLSLKDARIAAAQACAGEISRLLRAARDGDALIGGRAVQAGDCAVLVRTHAEGTLLRKALTSLGIGCVERSARSVFQTADAEEVERVLAAVLEPTRESLLRAALATEAIGLDAASIAALDADEAQATGIAQRFAGLRVAWLERGVGFMLRRWLNQDAVAARLLACPDGERRLTNLLHLIEILHQAAGQDPAPEAVLRWFRIQLRQAAASDETQLRLESDENLVQIITIHASKGLEFPIVFCPFLWRAPASGGERLQGVEYHDENGRLLIDWRKDLDPAFDEQEVKTRQQIERSAEFLRLVYVALTRAVHRCVLVAGCTLRGSQQSANEFSGKALESKSVQTDGLLNWIVGAGDLAPEQWAGAKLPIQAVAQAWASLAERAQGTISLQVLPHPSQVDLSGSGDRVPQFKALPAPSAMASAWRIGSFSSLVHGASHELSAADRDLRIDAGPATGVMSPLADTDILLFERGPQAGECLHGLLESIDFTDPQSWPPAIQAALRRTRGLPLGEQMLQGMLQNLLNTALPIGTTNPLRLADLPLDRRLTELEFHLTCAGLRDRDLNRVLRSQGYPWLRLGFSPLQGFLKGFIDLVFEHEGRYFVLDWKSNHLGNHPADYGRAQMSAEMTRHAYHLQSLLYCVALDRYLRQRIAGYDRQHHFGGSVYLFVRAVRPNWVLDDGSPAGVYFDRPSDALIDELDSLLAGGGRGNA
jgi:exodeoxyribonuclease V beta subunit